MNNKITGNQNQDPPLQTELPFKAADDITALFNYNKQNVIVHWYGC